MNSKDIRDRFFRVTGEPGEFMENVKITYPDAAKIMNMPLKTIYGYIRRGLLPVRKIPSGPAYILGQDLLGEDFNVAVDYNKKKGFRSKTDKIIEA
jgi:hypothetical protein